jgi:nucleoside-triphosphatase
MDMNVPRLWLLTGARGAGKTTFCRFLAARAHIQGWDTAGLLSPAVFEGGIKTGILAEDVRTGETHRLASSSPHYSFDLQQGIWYFDRSTLAWGNHMIESSLPCDLLILDELGPLELTRHGGWQAALDVLRGDGYHIALVVIRPELRYLVYRLLNFSETIIIDRTQSIDQWVRLYWRKIEAAGFPKSQSLNASRHS